jgi:hypothetical protein
MLLKRLGERRMSVSVELINVVRSYAEEFGASNILIAVPMEWEAFGKALTGAELTRLAFTANGKIEVSAYNGMVRLLHYEVDAEAVVMDTLSNQGLSAAA